MLDNQSYYIFLYDISCNKRRNKVFKTLQQFGGSYQYSVFEARLTARQFVRLEAELKKLIDQKSDKLAILKICESCRNRATLLGMQNTNICQHVIII